MCTVILPPGYNPTAVKKYIICCLFICFFLFCVFLCSVCVVVMSLNWHVCWWTITLINTYWIVIINIIIIIIICCCCCCCCCCDKCLMLSDLYAAEMFCSSITKLPSQRKTWNIWCVKREVLKGENGKASCRKQKMRIFERDGKHLR